MTEVKRLEMIREIAVGLDYVDVEPGADLDVRLQLTDDNVWHIWTGDPSYDTDHTGHWGCGVLGARADGPARAALAEQMLDEALDSRACSEK